MEIQNPSVTPLFQSEPLRRRIRVPSGYGPSMIDAPTAVAPHTLAMVRMSRTFFVAMTGQTVHIARNMQPKSTAIGQAVAMVAIHDPPQCHDSGRECSDASVERLRRHLRPSP